MVALFSWKWEQKEWRDGLSEAIAMWIRVKRSYVICRVGQAKSYVCLQGGWVGQKRPKTCSCNNQRILKTIFKYEVRHSYQMERKMQIKVESMWVCVLTVEEFHSEAGEIQYLFAPKCTPSKDFLIHCKTTWGRAIKNRAQFY